MSLSFDVVDEKVAEAEFFIGKMCEAGSDWFSFRCYLSAYLSASRTITLSLQRFSDLPEFDKWYMPHRKRLKDDPLAKFLLEARNDHVHGGPCPASRGVFHQGIATYFFQTGGQFKSRDIVSCCRYHFICLLAIVYDCYLEFGQHIDPQQYYTSGHFAAMGKTIDQAEVEVYGWVMESFIEEGYDDDDRWHELRGRVGECIINHLFKAYLGKVTPQPEVPERIRDFDFSDEDRGWTHVPAGFASVHEYSEWLRHQATSDE